MEAMPPPMAIPCIRVDDGQNADDIAPTDEIRWGPYSAPQQAGSYYNDQQQEQHTLQSSHTSAPHPPFKLVTDLSNFNTHNYAHQDQITLERFMEDQINFHAIQSAPVRELSPFETCTWVQEPASAITQYHERLSSPDETILSSASGSYYWPSSTFSSSRFDGGSCTSASHDPSMSRRGSTFGSMSAASDVHDPFAWSRSETTYSIGDGPKAHPVSDMSSLGGGVSFATPNVPSSSQASRHVTPFTAMFNSDMEVDCSTRASSIPPQPRQSTSAPSQHSYNLSTHSAPQFRHASPHESLQIPGRKSLTPGVDHLSDFDMPHKSDNDCDSDYTPGRAIRSPRSRAHRQVRSTGHIRRPSGYNAHQRSSSYNPGPNTSPTAHRVAKRPHQRRPSSTSHVPQYSPKTSARHAQAHSLAYHAFDPTVHPPTQQAPRPFTCPLTPYSCPKTFTSKNEWKRHVLTQHLLLGFWRCDLCPDATTRPNDFNRKDLFVQHLRRMHCGDRRGAATVFDSPDSVEQNDTSSSHHHATPLPTPEKMQLMTSPAGETTETALDRVRKRCWIQLRNPPRELACAFCAKKFESRPSPVAGQEQERDRGCAVEWLEHVGRHLVALTGSTSPTGNGAVKTEEGESKKGHRRRKSGSKSDGEISVASDEGTMGHTEPPWESDTQLLSWLIEEGLVEEKQDAPGWVLVDRGVASEAAIARREERDAEGDVE